MPGTHEFPQCCGITILSGFTSSSLTYNNYTPDDLTRLSSWIETAVSVNKSVGMLLAAINSTQYDAGLGNILTGNGFKLLAGGFYHPGHGRHIYLFGLEIRPEHHKDVKTEVGKEEKEVPLPKKKVIRTFGSQSPKGDRKFSPPVKPGGITRVTNKNYVSNFSYSDILRMNLDDPW